MKTLVAMIILVVSFMYFAESASYFAHGVKTAHEQRIEAALNQ